MTFTIPDSLSHFPSALHHPSPEWSASKDVVAISQSKSSTHHCVMDRAGQECICRKANTLTFETCMNWRRNDEAYLMRKDDGTVEAVTPYWKSPPGTMYCSFCRKSQHQVHYLIAGPGSYICDECTDLCKETVDAERRRAMKKAGPPVDLKKDFS